MLADDVFDHGGEDLEPVVPDDDPLDPAVQENVALAVHVADVAAVHPHPAVGVLAQDDGGLLGLFVVALHDAGARDADLAPLADGQLGLGARLKDGDDGPRQGQAHGAGLVAGAGRGRGGRAHLGHAVALGQGVGGVVAGQKVVHRLFSPQGDGVPAAGKVQHEGEVLLFQLGVGGQHLVVGRHAEHMGGLVLEHQLAQLGGVQVGDDDHRDAQRQGQVDAAGIAVGDEGGHHVQQLLLALEHHLVGGELLGQGVEGGVPQQHPFGAAGGAAGVDHHAAVVGVKGLAGGAGALARRHELLPEHDVGGVAVAVGVGGGVGQLHGPAQRLGRGKDQHLFHGGAAGGLVALVVEQVHADQHPGAGFLDVLVDALGAVAGVHQVQGGAHHVGGVEQVDQLGGHDADRRHDVPLAHPGGPQGGGGLFHVDDQGGVADVDAVVVQGDVRQVALVLAADVLESRAVGHRHIPVFGVVKGHPGLGLGGVDRLIGDRHSVPFSLESDPSRAGGLCARIHSII